MKRSLMDKLPAIIALYLVGVVIYVIGGIMAGMATHLIIANLLMGVGVSFFVLAILMVTGIASEGT